MIGVPDELAGEIPKAYVVPKPDARVTETELIKYVTGEMNKTRANFEGCYNSVVFQKH